MLIKCVASILSFKKKASLLVLFIFSVITSYAVNYATAGVDTWDVNGVPPSPCTTTITINHSMTDHGLSFDLNGGTLIVNAFCNIASFSMNASSVLTINAGGSLKLDGAIVITGGDIAVDVAGNFNCAGSATSGGTTSFVMNGTMGVGGNFTNNSIITGAGAPHLIVGGVLDESGGGSHTGVTLPVELVAFSVYKEVENVVVNWTTASEINSDYFAVLRSLDGKTFECIATVEAAGNDTAVSNYRYIDPLPLTGVGYYQLLEVDINGVTQRSQIVAIDYSGKLNTITQLYPNPVVDNASLFFSSSKAGMYELRVSGISGQIMYSAIVPVVIGENNFSISMEDYEGGIYWLALSDKVDILSAVQIIKK